MSVLNVKLANKVIEALQKAKEVLIREGETDFSELRPRDKREIYDVVTKTIGRGHFESDGDEGGCWEYFRIGDSCRIVFFAKGAEYMNEIRRYLTEFSVDDDGGDTISAIDRVMSELKKEMSNSMPLALLNTSILTADGTFTLRTIALEEARELIEEHANLDSAIGHESTAQIMSELLGVDVPVNRQMFEQQPGQKALVFKLNGRPPEGKILTAEEIEQIGYRFQILEMQS